MNIRRRAAGWTDDVLLKVVELFYRKHMKIEEIAKELYYSRQTIARMLRTAESEGIVRVIISSRAKHQDLCDLEDQMKERFSCLRDVILVPGNPCLLRDGIIDDLTKDGIVYSITETAARYLEKRISDKDTVALGSGDIVKRTVNGMRFQEPLLNVNICPLHGAFGERLFNTDANKIAADLQRMCYGRCWTLNVPSILPTDSIYNTICSLRSVSISLHILEKANIIICSLGTLTVRKLAYLRKCGASKEQTFELRKLVKSDNPPAGEIGGRLYAIDGSEIETDWKVVGLDLHKIREISGSKQTRVVAIVGADPDRYRSIIGALRGGLINTLITDHVTAHEVLRLTL